MPILLAIPADELRPGETTLQVLDRELFSLADQDRHRSLAAGCDQDPAEGGVSVGNEAPNDIEVPRRRGPGGGGSPRRPDRRRATDRPFVGKPCHHRTLSPRTLDGDAIPRA